MIDKRFLIIFTFMFCFTGVISYLVWRVFLLERFFKIEQVQEGTAYEEVDFHIPVKTFLKRCAASPELSYVRRLFVNQWISSNQKDLAILIMYAQGSTNYEEMKKAFDNAITKEPSKTAAAKFITSAIGIIDKDPELIMHVNKSLQQGYTQAIHSLRGEIMQTEKDSKEYKRLITEYKKELYKWIDQKHGKLFDEIIAQL